MAKRSRVVDENDDGNELEELSQQSDASPSAKKKARTSGARHAMDEEEDEDEEEEDEEEGEEDEDDEAFEAEHSQYIREQMQSQMNQKGGIAEAGIIQKVQLVNFMCHTFLEFELGPQLNFIIGHNGSGKSAILTGITIALGGRANSTNRGNSLKSFIKGGCSSAQVTLELKNTGPEAYKPKVYGKKIVVERTIKDQGSSYKLKDYNNKVVNGNKGELNAICDHFMIQVDNPMNVLSQDAARQFLSASHAKEKYQFFLKGTQLTQLSEEYEMITTNIGSMHDTVLRKRDVLPELEAARRQASQRFKEVERARTEKSKLEELKKEYAWALPVAKEKEVRAQEVEVERLQSRLPQLDEKIREAQGHHDFASAEINRLEGLIASENEGQAPLKTQKEQLLASINEAKSKLKALKDQERQLNANVSELRATINDFQGKIDAEHQRRQVDNTDKYASIEAAIASLSAEVETAKETERAANAEYQEMQRQQQADMAALDDLRQEVDMRRGEALNISNHIQQMQRVQVDHLSAYGQNVTRLLDDIARERWTERPIGPLGRHAKLVDPKWGPVLESVLGQTLDSFAVFHNDDRTKLLKLMKKHRCFNMIIKPGQRSFDFRHGEPDPDFATIDRVLSFDNDVVRCIFVDQNKTESSILVEHRADADQIMRSRPANVVNCYVLRGLFKVGGVGVGSSNQTLNAHRGAPRLTTDVANAIAEAKHQHQEANAALAAAQHRQRDIENRRMSYERQIQAARTRARNAANTQRSCADRITRHKDEMREDEPPNIGAMEDAKKDTEDEYSSLVQQFEGIANDRVELEDELRPLHQQYEEVKRALDSYGNERAKFTTELDTAVTARITAQNALTHRNKQMADATAKLEAAKQNLEALRVELEGVIAQAEEFSERVPTIRSQGEIRREITGIENALRTREERQGMSVEAVTAEYNRASEAYETAQRTVKEMEVFIKAMKKALSMRMDKWLEFRKFIALRAKYLFMYHLSNRGYYGNITFNHHDRRLDLKVQTDDQIATQKGSREKDPKSLSGGEKSFSTICLLLSLWEAIGCPIRCLDEFDVFMDAVNRKISMKMMVETAKAANGIQYVLITPQDMANVSLGPEVRVHRMADPERSNARA